MLKINVVLCLIHHITTDTKMTFINKRLQPKAYESRHLVQFNYPFRQTPDNVNIIAYDSLQLSESMRNLPGLQTQHVNSQCKDDVCFHRLLFIHSAGHQLASRQPDLTCSYSFMVLARTGDIRPLPPARTGTTNAPVQEQICATNDK